MKYVRESSIGIVNDKRLYDITPEIQAFDSVESAAAFFEYTNAWGEVVSPIDKASFEGIKLPVLRELSEGIEWAKNRFHLQSDMPRSFRRDSLRTRVLGDYDDRTRVVRFRKGLTREYAFSTAVHEMAHHADNVMGFPSADIVKSVCHVLRAEHSLSEINRMKAEIAGTQWRDANELMAYSLEKYCVGKGNVLAREIAREFIRRCENQ